MTQSPAPTIATTATTASAAPKAAPAPKSVLNESRQIERAVTLIKMGARMQVLESETTLSYERLIRLYKEITGKSPSKGQLPFSTDWFLTWQENIHSSLFLNIYEYLDKGASLDAIDALTKAYRLYLEQVQAGGIDPLLSFTRAWRLLKFVDASMLELTTCSKCKGRFVTEPYENAKHFVCGMCNPPARAGKSKLAGAIGLN
ncbi:flagellar transcriptional regulator FlhC [Xylophilus sp. GOD-11R]|uniref:flagellar transcriptional regulator FlhC n=1 Tax=Xylophilus sp. GOD-11R TaxID=3089814 RepID=UPI00298CF11E|nr:flagellar transcriptional regulator FlhC [Xylophilus sp. GOD-11R]WPB55560.1 flagellar transcriptional regulator FlhC [Xylophilus sp. GOD-11R]